MVVVGGLAAPCAREASVDKAEVKTTEETVSALQRGDSHRYRGGVRAREAIAVRQCMLSIPCPDFYTRRRCRRPEQKTHTCISGEFFIQSWRNGANVYSAK